MTKRRSDFNENRQRILQAADEIFVENGVSAPLDSIAKRAGIGRATFFRHFPERRALINEMLDNFLTDLEKISEDLPENGQALFEIVKVLYDRMVHYAPIADYLRAQSRDDPALLVAIDRFHALLRPHVKRAVEEGLVRPDLREADVVIFAVMLAAAATTPTVEEEGRKRAYELVYNGLRIQG